MASPTPVPAQFSRTTGTQITFPTGLQLSPDGKYLYVACNGDNSLAIIDTTRPSNPLVQLAQGHPLVLIEAYSISQIGVSFEKVYLLNFVRMGARVTQDEQSVPDVNHVDQQ